MEADVMQSARDYFHIVGFQLPVFGDYYSALLPRSTQPGQQHDLDGLQPIVNLINVAGNFWFIRIMGLGAGGAALATALSRGVVCLLLCALVAHSGMLHDPGTVTLADCRSLTGKMLRIGVPWRRKLAVQFGQAAGPAALRLAGHNGAWQPMPLQGHSPVLPRCWPGGAISLAMLPVIGQAIGGQA